MRQAESQPNSGRETFANKANRLAHNVRRYALDRLKINNSPQLATATEGIGDLNSASGAEDPELSNTFQLKLRPAHARAGAGTAGTAARRHGETKPGREKGKGLGWGKKIGIGIGLAGIAAGGVGAYEVLHDNNVIPVTRPENPSGNPSGDFEKKFPIALPQDGFAPVTPEETQILWQSTQALDLEKRTLTMGIPFDPETVKRSPNLRISQEYEVLLPPSEEKKYQRAGVQNIEAMSGLSRGDEYRIVYDETKWDASVIRLDVAGTTIGEGRNSFKPAYSSYWIFLRDRETGKTIAGQTVSGLYAEPLVDTNPAPTDHGAAYEDGVPVRSGQSILRLTTNLKDWDGKNDVPLRLRPKGQFQIVSFSFEKSPYDPRIELPLPLSQAFLNTPLGKIALSQIP